MTTYAYQIQAFQVDFQRKATMTTIGNYLLQTAGQDADRRGFGLDFMLPNNRAWVLARFSIRMDQYPGPQDIIKIQTWIHDIGALMSTRKFNILNEAEQKIGEASSSWVAMDLKSRRPLRLSSFLKPDYIQEQPGHQLPPPPKLTYKERYYTSKDFRVVYSDLDLNRHVYSIRYIQWILDSIPLEDFAAKKIRQLDINYLSEAFYDDEIKVLGDHSSDKESHLLIKNPLTKKNIVVAHLLWDTGV
jgi:medium-chain acyl-[acyl-carrier-protein] hydrolase